MRAREEDYHGEHRHLQDDPQQRVRALYLPKEWTDDPARLKAAHVLSDMGFATKPKIARRMVARAVAAKVPFSFAAADSVYGSGEIETCCARREKATFWGFLQSRVPFPGQAAACRPHHLRDRAEPCQEGLAPLGVRRRDQRSALASGPAIRR